MVFLPLTLLTGVTGVFFRSLALTMAVALLTSLVLALSFTPVLAERFVKAETANESARRHRRRSRMKPSSKKKKRTAGFWARSSGVMNGCCGTRLTIVGW